MLRFGGAVYRSGIGRRVIFNVVIFGVLVTMLITAVQLYRGYRNDVRQIKTQLQQIESVHLDSLTATLWASDKKELKIHLEGISQIRDIQYLEIRDGDEVWAAVGTSQDTNVMRVEYSMRFTHRGADIEIGTLQVVASLDGVYHRLIIRFWENLVANAAVIFLVSAFLLLMLHQLIARHLTRIADFTRALDIAGLDKPLSLMRRKPKKTDELDRVVSAINQMQANIKDSFHALQQSELRFQTLARVSPVGIFRANTQGDCIYTNERWLTQAGLNEMDALGDGWARALHPDDRERVTSEWYEAAKAESPFSTECRFKRPDGEIAWLLIQVEAERDAQGKVVCFIGTTTEITEQREVEETVRYVAEGVSRHTGEAFFQSLVKHIAELFHTQYVFIGLLDEKNEGWVSTLALCVDGKIDANIGYALAGTPCEDVIGGKCDSIQTYPRDIQRLFPEDIMLVEMGAESYIGIPLSDNLDKPIGLIVVMDTKPMDRPERVVTILQIFATRAAAEIERIRIEKALHEWQQMLRLVLDSIPVRVFWKDLDSAYIGCNRLFAQDAGLNGAEEIVGKKDSDLSWKDLAAQFRHSDLEVIRSGDAKVNYEDPQITMDGANVVLLTSKVPLRRMDGQIFGVLGVYEDVTERKLTDESLRRSQKMEAVGQLSGGIAHDFNNQLGIVIGCLDFLKGLEKGNADQSEWIDDATRATEHCIDLTRQLLSFARGEAKETTVVDVPSALQGMETMISRAVTPSVSVKYTSREDSWPVAMDRGELQDAFLNLVLNARDAMPDGGELSIEISNEFLDEDYSASHVGLKAGDYLQITLSDTGVGMDKATLEHVFEPFFSTKPRDKGTGLGMAMVYGFVKRNSGYVQIYSEPGMGTVVRMYFPRVTHDVTVSHPDRVPENMPEGNERVLVVDDEAGLLALAGKYLRSLGYRTVSAKDGQSALKILAEDTAFDLLFSDVVMPGGIDGYDLAKKATKLKPGIKVLLTSGFVATEIGDNGPSLFARNLLGKPYRKSDLAERVRLVLDENVT